eukprot:gene8468-9375_t
MEKMLKKLKEENFKAGLSLNIKNTKVMYTGKKQNPVLDGKKMDEKEKFVLAKYTTTRLAQQRSKEDWPWEEQKLTSFSTLWKDKHIDLKAKVTLLESLVYSIVLYGSKSWVANKQ